MSESCYPGFIAPISFSLASTNGAAGKEYIPGAERAGYIPQRWPSCSVVDEPQRVIRGETSQRSQTAHIDWFAFTLKLQSGLEESPAIWVLSQLFTVFGLPTFHA